MRLTLVGPMRVVVDDQPVAVHGSKPQALLAAVSLSPRPPSREWLCALLWPEADAPRAAAALRTTLWRLRVALGGADAVRSDDRSVALDRTVCSCDVDDLDVIRSTPSLDDHTLGRVQSTLGALTAGELLHGMTGDNLQLEDWIEQQRRCWHQRVQTELDRLCLALLRAGRFSEAVTVARSLVDRQPLCEAAHRRLIECQVLMGDLAAAHISYAECVAILEAELGIDPSAETRAALVGAAPARAVMTAGSTRASVELALAYPLACPPRRAVARPVRRRPDRGIARRGR